MRVLQLFVMANKSENVLLTSFFTLMSDFLV